MSLRRSIRSASLVQFPGAVLAYLAVITLGVRFGSDGLGTFSLVQTRQQFLAAVAMLGLPQALVYFVSVGSVSLKRQQILRYAVTVLGLFLGIAVGMKQLPGSNAIALMFGLAVASVVLATMQRSVVLGAGRTMAYSMLTAMPQVALFLLVVMTIALAAPGSTLGLTLSVAIVMLPYLLASGAGWAVQRAGGEARNSLDSALSAESASNGALLRYALPAALVGVAATGARAGWLSYVHDTSGLRATGLVSAALLISQTVTYPIVLLSPILVHHWANRADARLRRIVILGVVVVVCTVVGAGILLSLISAKLSIWQDSAYAPLLSGAWLVSLIVSADVAYGLAGTIGLASGDSWIQAVSESSRIAVLVLAAGVGQVSSLDSMVGAWALGAWVCALGAWALVLIRGRKSTRSQPQSSSAIQPGGAE